MMEGSEIGEVRAIMCAVDKVSLTSHLVIKLLSKLRNIPQGSQNTQLAILGFEHPLLSPPLPERFPPSGQPSCQAIERTII